MLKDTLKLSPAFIQKKLIYFYPSCFLKAKKCHETNDYNLFGPVLHQHKIWSQFKYLFISLLSTRDVGSPPFAQITIAGYELMKHQKNSFLTVDAGHLKSPNFLSFLILDYCAFDFCFLCCQCFCQSLFPLFSLSISFFPVHAS